jgi:hypothetical protein
MYLCPQLKKTILISAFGHAVVFGLFSFSFGHRMQKLNYAPLIFWGDLFRNSEVRAPQISQSASGTMALIHGPGTIALADRGRRSLPLPEKFFIKPLSGPVVISEKTAFMDPPALKPAILRKNEPTVILHPLLPYGFKLYFRDRQVAHMELEFRIEPFGQRNPITLKRKVSSGNLEVDLLSMRYIWHYLFIQPAKFSPNDWQTVKIDLSEKDK